MEVRQANLSDIVCCFTCIYSGSHYEGAKVECTRRCGKKLRFGDDYVNHYFDVCDNFSHRGN